jgi:hypothetical protein
MLPLSTVINVSVSELAVGLANYRLGNLLLVSSEAKPGTYGTTSYGIYTSPDAVLTDYGSGSETYQIAEAVFAQQPNILANNGKLIIYPGQSNLKTAFDTFGTSSIFFSGIISNTYPASGTMKTLADDVQAYENKILFLPSNSSADITGAFTDIKNAGDDQTRCLYYSGTALEGKLLAAAYASRLLGTNLSGSKTAITMQFKNLVTIIPDENVTATVLDLCEAAGVDVYIDVAGVPMVYSTGANRFADQVYNQIWLVSSLEVAAFNALYGVSNKIPQTEDGMNLLKAALRLVLAQGVVNGYLAPGVWTSATTFGNQENFLANILQYGYYVYSLPVSQQSVADREDRIAPYIQIACKEAGAVQSSNILVYINP